MKTTVVTIRGGPIGRISASLDIVAGFTLFEVAISLLIVSFSVISMVMIFPVGLRMQQRVRYQILASTQALQLIDGFASRSNAERLANAELPRPWEGSGFCHSSTRWDIETQMGRWNAGIMPLPTEIARRLDSDGDEIQRILDAGGQIYYADPGSVPCIDYRYRNTAPPNESQKIVFAVRGYAQHNAITVFPYKAMPYRAAYPSPPICTALYDQDGNNIHYGAKDVDYDAGMGLKDFFLTKAFNGIFRPKEPVYTAVVLRPQRYEYKNSGRDEYGNSINPQYAYREMGYRADLIEGWCDGSPGTGMLPSRDPKMIRVFEAYHDYWEVWRALDHVGPIGARVTSYDQKTCDAASTALVGAVVDFCQDKYQHGKITEVSHLDTMGPSEEFKTYVIPQPMDSDAAYVALGQHYDDEFASLCHRAESIPTQRGDLGGLSATRARMRAEIALRVQCFRFLAHAIATFNQEKSTDPATATVRGSTCRVGLRASLSQLSPIAVGGAGNLVISERLMRYYQDRCKATVMRYAAGFPYDWAAPRPLERAIMMDQPLFEWDMFTPPSTGTIYNTGVKAAMWRPISAQAVTSPGMPSTYPGVMTGDTFDNARTPFPAWNDRGPNDLWGDPRHFTLTRRFDPYERCRQLVFWSVDWRSYEDAETAPSATIDASRAPIRCVFKNDREGRYFLDRCYNGKSAGSDTGGFFLGNPERPLCFTDDIQAQSTGADMENFLMANRNGAKNLDARWYNKNAPAVFNGIYGADRNHNYVLDRGGAESHPASACRDGFSDEFLRPPHPHRFPLRACPCLIANPHPPVVVSPCWSCSSRLPPVRWWC